MASEITKLWTLQEPLFSLTSGTVDHSKSAFYNDLGLVPQAYRRLWDMIGEPRGQVLWCYTVDDLPRTGISKRKWSLAVPEDQVICRINDCAWNIIIEMTDVFYAAPGDVITPQLERPPESGDWWDKVINRDVKAHRYISALIRHPVPETWVVESGDWRVRSVS